MKQANAFQTSGISKTQQAKTNIDMQTNSIKTRRTMPSNQDVFLNQNEKRFAD